MGMIFCATVRITVRACVAICRMLEGPGETGCRTTDWNSDDLPQRSEPSPQLQARRALPHASSAPSWCSRARALGCQVCKGLKLGAEPRIGTPATCPNKGLDPGRRSRRGWLCHAVLCLFFNVRSDVDPCPRGSKGGWDVPAPFRVQFPLRRNAKTPSNLGVITTVP
ncbi:hypothetical protein MnTg02_02596 [bacterium MnTg02]|nr:hypothetical protein MnTg02_02596 [bacterium MnTg02]